MEPHASKGTRSAEYPAPGDSNGGKGSMVQEVGTVSQPRAAGDAFAMRAVSRAGPGF